MWLEYFLWSFLVFTIICVIYYVSNRKKRKIAFYNKTDLNWIEVTPREQQKKTYSVFLIGDAGAPSLLKQEPTLKILQNQLEQVDENSAVFFLGDNIYPTGFPLTSDPEHETAEKRLVEQLKITKNFKGRVCMISGNHDWNKGRAGGFQAMMRQQAYVDGYFGKKDVYLPRNGCPDPVEIQATPFLTFVVLNTQWWVHTSTKPIGKSGGCSINNEQEFFVELTKILERNKDKTIVVIGHHPMYSKAMHGGKFDMKQHLFPLTEVNKKMYIPLPIAGSIYPIYRKYIGSREDMAHPRYRNLRKRLIAIFEKYDGLIYAAGHDHNLQYIKKHNQHYIVSGAGCKVTYVQKGSGAYFTHAHKGFFRLDYYDNGDLWLEVWEPDELGEASLVYRKELHDNDLIGDMIKQQTVARPKDELHTSP
ncbi:MAG TPA: metallophosphoesterase [Cytophagaceae bacterium]|jgi:calcineurin-like phosphoesterase family protein